MGWFTREEESLRFVERGLERSKTAASTLLTPAGEKRFHDMCILRKSLKKGEKDKVKIPLK